VAMNTVQLDLLIDGLENKYSVTLSSEARRTLIGPVLEAHAFGSPVTDADIQTSIEKIVATASQVHDPLSRSVNRISSVGVNRAIYKNYCNVPPFCAP
jgi:hypothetical protein